MTAHETTVADLGEGTARYQAGCGCGWSGQCRPWAEQARNDAAAHVNLQALKREMRTATDQHKAIAGRRWN